MNKIFIKSILAGIMIGIGGITYINVGGIIGAFLFSFGLLTIVTQGFFLYTGMIGYIKNFKELPKFICIITGNFIGTWITSFLIKITKNTKVDEYRNVIIGKMDYDILSIFILSFFCGILMFLAIDNYKKIKNILFVTFPVIIFILCGFNHSIANMFYFNLYSMYSLKSFLYLFIMIIGNGIGAVVFNKLINIGE